MNICNRCHREFEYKSASGMGRSRCNPCSVTVHRQERKKKLVELFGGCCQICGYNKCVASLDFHHRDPSTKLFSIGGNGETRKLEKQIEEANKCILEKFMQGLQTFPSSETVSRTAVNR